MKFFKFIFNIVWLSFVAVYYATALAVTLAATAYALGVLRRA
jgi:hypothetical protein